MFFVRIGTYDDLESDEEIPIFDFEALIATAEVESQQEITESTTEVATTESTTPYTEYYTTTIPTTTTTTTPAYYSGLINVIQIDKDTSFNIEHGSSIDLVCHLSGTYNKVYI